MHPTFAGGLVRREMWLANQAYSRKVDRTIELGLDFAEPTMSVTENGADVGDNATISFFEGPRHDNIGSVQSGQSALAVAGKFDIRATLFSTEGWLRDVALTGKPHLTIVLQAMKTEQPRIGGPAPNACTIEVYGVNFDFDKAQPRADSEPMLKQVLALFTGTPSFSAEIGGHTDTVGTEAYNIKLSDARAAAVKNWLVKLQRANCR